MDDLWKKDWGIGQLKDEVRSGLVQIGTRDAAWNM